MWKKNAETFLEKGEYFRKILCKLIKFCLQSFIILHFWFHILLVKEPIKILETKRGFKIYGKCFWNIDFSADRVMGNVKLLYLFIFMRVFVFSYSMNLMQSAMKKITETFPNTAEVVHENLM